MDYHVDDRISFATRSLGDDTGIATIEDNTIAFEGVIYNSEDIENQSAKDKAMSSSSAVAEFVLRHFKQKGYRIFAEFLGNFAGAIWDNSRRELTLFRDHFGQSSLYYSFVDGRLCFASEIKSLLQVENCPKLVDLEAVANYLMYGCVFSPRTLFSGITRLPAASLISFREKDMQNFSHYWTFEFAPKILDKNDAMNRIYQLLLKTVERSVRRHKRFALLLSGGFDSSLTAALVRKCTDNRIGAYTFVPTGERNKSAELIANRLDLVYNEITLSLKESIKILEILPKIHENLISDPFISLPTYALAKAARDEEVVFAADGADSIFWGMPSIYKRFIFYNALQGLPEKLRKGLLYLSGRFKRTHLYQRSLDNFLRASFSDTPYMFTGRIFTEDDVHKLLGKYKPSSVEIHRKHARKRITLTDFYRYQLRTSPDRPAMTSRIGPICSTFSLKLFEPFLNPRLVELATAIPPSYKQPSATQDKLILREMAQKYALLPNGFRPKKVGLSCSLDNWMKEGLYEWVCQTLIERLPPFLDKDYVMAFLKRRHFLDIMYNRTSANRTASRDLLTILMLTLWFEEYKPAMGHL